MSDDARRKLEEMTARAEREARQASNRRNVDDRSAAAAASSAEERRRRAQARAPIGFVGSPRFMVMALSGGLIGMSWVALHEALPAVVNGAALAWLVVTAAIVIDVYTWRRRLGFTLEGYERIDGTSPAEDGFAPWIAFSVAIYLRDVSADAVRQRDRVLEMLITRIDKMHKADNDLSSRAPVWHRSDTATAGDTGYPIYAKRVIERWLRREVRLLAAAYPIDRVVVSARYTGGGFHVSTMSID